VERARLSLWWPVGDTAGNNRCALVAWLLARVSLGQALRKCACTALVFAPVVKAICCFDEFGRTRLGRALDAIGLQLAFHWSGGGAGAAISWVPADGRHAAAIERRPQARGRLPQTGAPAPASVARAPCRLIIAPVVWRDKVMDLPSMASSGTITVVANIPPDQTCQAPIWRVAANSRWEDQALVMWLMSISHRVSDVLLSRWLARRRCNGLQAHDALASPCRTAFDALRWTSRFEARGRHHCAVLAGRGPEYPP